MKICFENGAKSGTELELALPEISIGYKEGNTLCLSEVGVSRNHAIILHSNDGWRVRDLGSTNGVKVNGQKIDGEQSLAENDIVEIGVQRMRLCELSENGPRLVFSPLEAPEEELAASRKTAPLAKEEPPARRRVNKTEVLDTAKAADLTAMLTSKGETLFDPKQLSKPGAQETKKAAKSGSGKKRSGSFFYILVAAVAVIGISAAMLALKPAEKRVGQGGEKLVAGTPFSLFFERDIVSRDNVFRFALLLENGRMQFSVDDLKSQRHVSRTEKISDEMVEMLRSRIDGSGLWTEPPQGSMPGTGGVTQVRRVMVADGKRVKDLAFVGSYAPSCFGIVESIVDDLAGTYGVLTVSLTPEELRRLAESNFARGEDLFDNREARASNLREAIRRYRVTVGALEQFIPRPALWERAKKRLDEAEGLRAQKLDSLEMERARLAQINDLATMRAVFLRVMELADEESPEYLRTRDRLFKLDASQRGQRKR